jgi:hypothetical protein
MHSAPRERHEARGRAQCTSCDRDRKLLSSHGTQPCCRHALQNGALVHKSIDKRRHIVNPGLDVTVAATPAATATATAIAAATSTTAAYRGDSSSSSRLLLCDCERCALRVSLRHQWIHSPRRAAWSRVPGDEQETRGDPRLVKTCTASCHRHRDGRRADVCDATLQRHVRIDRFKLSVSDDALNGRSHKRDVLRWKPPVCCFTVF